VARIRSVKPEFWIDEKLAAATSRDARLVYVGLWNLADEHSRLRGSAAYIKGQLFPYDDDLTPATLGRLVDELEQVGAVQRYAVDDEGYIYLPKLARHQRLEPDKVPSRLPPPPFEVDRPEPDPDRSARRTDESASDAEDHALLYVAGSREHVAGSRDTRGAARTQTSAAFDEFWSIYPRREAKAAARKAWDKAIKRADPADICAGAKRYRDQPGRDPKFTAHAATWLNADRWADEPQSGSVVAIRAGPQQSTTDRRVGDAFALAEHYREIDGS